MKKKKKKRKKKEKKREKKTRLIFKHDKQYTNK